MRWRAAQVFVVDVNRTSNGSRGTLLEMTVPSMSGVLIIISGRLSIVLHVRRLVVRERHYRRATTRAGAANSNNRVQCSTTVCSISGVVGLIISRVRFVNGAFFDLMTGRTVMVGVIVRPDGDRHSVDQERRSKHCSSDKSEFKGDHVR